MPYALAALALLAALASPPLPVPVRATAAAHPSPDGRLLLTLERDEFFGQVATLSVVAEPNTRRARRIFRSVGDAPLRFLGWRDPRTAELEFPPQGEASAYRLRLTCGDEGCALERAPAGGG